MRYLTNIAWSHTIHPVLQERVKIYQGVRTAERIDFVGVCMMAVPLTFTIPEVARLLGTSIASGYRMAKGFPRAPIPGRWRITRADLERVLGTPLTEQDAAKARGAAATSTALPSPIPGHLDALAETVPDAQAAN
jgi:hypothetical protein